MSDGERTLPVRADLPPPGGTVHLLGAAGAGMQGLALLLVHEGYRVTGSDRDPAPAASLAARGVRLFPESELSPVRQAELVVYSSAVPPEHPALRAARRTGIPAVKRARAMGALVNDRRLAAVSGTHGKTTLSAMLARIAERAGLDPTALVGGRVAAWDGNARPGAGGVCIVEADEYDRSFLELDPDLAVVTSVEPEHLECYRDYDDLSSAFVEFAGRAAGRDGVLTCADDAGARRVAAALGGGSSYGFAPTATYRVEVASRDPDGQLCCLHAPSGPVQFRVGAPGDHNAQNAGGALAGALLLGVPAHDLGEALRDFPGVDRRLQVLAVRNGRVVVDDYAHHPTEVRASIQALRGAYPGRSLAVVFQPHLYSRTAAMAAEFGTALAAADRAFVLPVYAARERPIAGVSSGLVVEACPAHVSEAKTDDVLAWMQSAPSELVVAFFGAGDVTELAHRVARELAGDAVGD